MIFENPVPLSIRKNLPFVFKEIGPILIVILSIKNLEGSPGRGRIGVEKAAGLVTRRSASSVVTQVEM